MENEILLRVTAVGRGSKSVVFCGFDLKHNRQGIPTSLF